MTNTVRTSSGKLIKRLQRAPTGSDDLLYDVTCLVKQGADPSVLLKGKQNIQVTAAYAAIETHCAIDVAGYLIERGATLLTAHQAALVNSSCIDEGGLDILTAIATAIRETDEMYIMESYAAAYAGDYSKELCGLANQVFLHLRDHYPIAFAHALLHPDLVPLLTRMGSENDRNTEVLNLAFRGGESIPAEFVHNLFKNDDGVHGFRWLLANRLAELREIAKTSDPPLATAMLNPNWPGDAFVAAMEAGLFTPDEIAKAQEYLDARGEWFKADSWRAARRLIVAARAAAETTSRRRPRPRTL